MHDEIILVPTHPSKSSAPSKTDSLKNANVNALMI